MKDIFTQWSLVEVIAAKIDRRLSLLAELHSIEQELVQAGVLLAELPSVKAARQVEAQALPAVAEAAPKRRRRRRTSPLVTRECACGGTFEVKRRSLRTTCDACFHDRRVEHMRQLGTARGQRLREVK